jgi:predicted Zn-dependent protease
MSDPRRFLSQAECAAVAERAFRFARGGGRTQLFITSWWTGALRWGRGRMVLASDRRNNTVMVSRSIDGAEARVRTNQLDDASLEGAVRAAERHLLRQPPRLKGLNDPPVRFEYPRTQIWSDASFDLDGSARSATAQDMMAPAAREGLLSSGYLEVSAAGSALIDSTGLSLYAPSTGAQCSMTVRDSKGTASGWAGRSSFDWKRIDSRTIARRAVEKCLASRNPVALEPGRYTVILEPQAVAALLQVMVQQGLNRSRAESNSGPFSAGGGNSKLGLRVADHHVTIGHDPSHPDLGVVPFTGDGDPIRPVTWIDRGTLTNLAYGRGYALTLLNDNLGYPNSFAFRMEGGESSIEEMIRTTTRGLLVTRFSNVGILDEDSLLLTGVTRDGLWLIEHGRITKAVKNLRFTESPLFVLNSLEQLGPSVPVFSPDVPVLVPSLKARDFSFTSLADAV